MAAVLPAVTGVMLLVRKQVREEASKYNVKHFIAAGLSGWQELTCDLGLVPHNSYGLS
jgi:hypothetical protein